MAQYTTITDTQVDPEAPITSELMTALRDNPIAIAEGASGAPRIDPSTAVDWASSTNTAAERTWVLDRNAGLTVGQVGTYAVLWYTNSSSVPLNAGSTVAGSQLLLNNVVSGNVSPFPSTSQTGGTTTPSGTWRAMAAVDHRATDPVTYFASLFVRIS